MALSVLTTGPSGHIVVHFLIVNFQVCMLSENLRWSIDPNKKLGRTVGETLRKTN